MSELSCADEDHPLKLTDTSPEKVNNDVDMAGMFA